MHLILLSGGSGKRLWPLSNEVRSKQFLKLLLNEDGGIESMVQRVHRQLKEIGGWDSITVAAAQSQKDQLMAQLGSDANIVIEPERRDTFPAIALASCYLFDKCGVKPNETIAVLPVDPFVESDYFKLISDFPKILEDDQCELVLMGATPIKPSEKYGYIIPENEGVISNVEYFKEKPDLHIAKTLIEQGALWNCGVFGLKLKHILNILKTKYEFTDFTYDYANKQFLNLIRTSFDYEVVEKAHKIKVIKYTGQWKDLGTWETLTEEMDRHVRGNALTDKNCDDTHIYNELDIPIIAMGVKNSIVVASNDGILVAEKGETYRLKEFLSDDTSRPMYEEKRWGKYKVMEHTYYEDGTEALTKKLYLERDKKISYQYHINRKEIWTILKGKGLLYLEGTKKEIVPGDIKQINAYQKHAILALEDLELIEVQLGFPLIEDDIVRIDFEW